MAKLRKVDIEAAIATEDYSVLPNGRTTICTLTLKNGYSVTGESSVLDLANFDAQIGKDEARKNAVEKIWSLEGYLAKQKEYEGVADKPERDMDFGNALRALKRGKKVARTGWNGKDLWIELQVPDANSKMTLPYLFISYPADHAVYPGARVPWLASQTDMLSNDWKVVQ